MKKLMKALSLLVFLSSEDPKKASPNAITMIYALAERLLRKILIRLGKGIRLFITGTFDQVCSGSQTKWKCDIKSWSRRV
jgi:hypothetical protein